MRGEGAVLLVALLACRSLDPFENDTPKVESVNGVAYLNFGPVAFPRVEYADTASLFSFLVTPGEDWTVDIVIDDPEGRAVRLWFPEQPAGWDFDPDASSGVWHVPEILPPGLAENGITAFVEDPHPRDPRQKEFVIPVFHDPSADTGFGPR